MEHHIVLRMAAKLLTPFILIFALYVQFHGDFGPGGGFQAGVIFAAGGILYGLIFGVERVILIFPPEALRTLASLGVLLYIAVGVAGLLAGGSYLDYGVLSHDPVHGQELGVMLVELGVGCTVAAVMLLLFVSFTRR